MSLCFGRLRDAATCIDILAPRVNCPVSITQVWVVSLREFELYIGMNQILSALRSLIMGIIRCRLVDGI
jgi:hypothetical protein